MFAKATAQNLVYRLFDIAPDNFRRESPAPVHGRRARPERHAAAQAGGGGTGQRTDAARRTRAGGEHDRLLRGYHAARRQYRRARVDGRSRTQSGDRSRRQARFDSRCGRRGARRARSLAGARTCAALTIANRTPDKARKLAAEFADMGQISGCGFAELEGPPYDLIINATSASLQGEMPDMPVGLVGEETVCYDMAYGRGHTPFTLWAQIAARRRVPPRAGACWSNRRPSRSCFGAAYGRTPSRFCRPSRSSRAVGRQRRA